MKLKFDIHDDEFCKCGKKMFYRIMNHGVEYFCPKSVWYKPFSHSKIRFYNYEDRKAQH